MAFAYYITARRQLSSNDPLEGSAAGEDALRSKVAAAFQAGVDYVQLREKDLSGKHLGALVESLAELPEKARSQRPLRLLVNERLDVAGACGADGVHLPSDSLPLKAAKAKAGEDAIVGISCHSAEDVEQAGKDGASYVLLGPVFETPSKPEAKPLGVRLLRAICQHSVAPVFALGGINRDNIESCIRAGAVGVAGIRLFQNEPNIAALVRYVHAL